ncbi:MAG: alpha/beta hydrolase [Acidobacteria bacterium]|nr:alpha/beta hydrolase [Acidobacteriota bacterium]
MVRRHLALGLAVALAGSVGLAQTLAPLSPAPKLASTKDADGRPLPFGVPKYLTPETPGGSGPYPAIMVADPTAPEHIIYRPAKLPEGKLPVVVWGNGACIHAGNRFRSFLTEIASHGMLVISAGKMGEVALEVGPQENPVVRRPGQPAPPAAPVIPNAPGSARNFRSTSDHLIQGVDWAFATNAKTGHPLAGRIDTAHVAVAGQSCGGGIAITAAADPRITALGVFMSGTRIASAVPNADGVMPDLVAAKKRLDAIHTPVLIVTGDEMLDSAHFGGKDTFDYLSKVPVFYAWEEGLSHIGSYGAPNGGSLGRIAADWFSYQLRGDKKAGAMFTGANCTLCKEPTWHVAKKGGA